MQQQQQWLRIDGLAKWKALEGKQILNTAVRIQKCYHDYTTSNSYPCFVNATKVWVEDSNDKNFVYFWLESHIFPKVETIYLFAHPCDPRVFYRFPSHVQIILSPNFAQYKRRWVADLRNISVDHKQTLLDLQHTDEDVLVLSRL